MMLTLVCILGTAVNPRGLGTCRKLLPIVILTALFTTHLEAQTQQTQFIYDGRKEPLVLTASNSDVQEIRRIALPKARQVWRNEETCHEQLQVVTAANGAFTKPGIAQRAVLYRFCITGHDFANNGIAVFEGRKMVTHVVFKGGEDHYIGSLADINGNGVMEIVLGGGSMHQGYTNSVIRLIELSSLGVKKFGIADTYEDDCGAKETGCRMTAYRISAKTGEVPVFYRDVFRKRGAAWIKMGNPTKFSLRDDQGQYALLN